MVRFRLILLRLNPFGTFLRSEYVDLTEKRDANDACKIIWRRVKPPCKRRLMRIRSSVTTHPEKSDFVASRTPEFLFTMSRNFECVATEIWSIQWQNRNWRRHLDWASLIECELACRHMRLRNTKYISIDERRNLWDNSSNSSKELLKSAFQFNVLWGWHYWLARPVIFHSILVTELQQYKVSETLCSNNTAFLSALAFIVPIS